MLFKGVAAAYNAGTGNVGTWDGIDICTASDDYSNDVIARAQYLALRYPDQWGCKGSACDI